MSRRARPALALAAWVVLLAAGIVTLHRVGGPLAPPPVSAPDQLGQWLAQRQPAEAAFAVVRLVALAMGWYLLAVTMAGTLARLAGVPVAVWAADCLSAPALRRLLNGALGMSMAATVLAGSPALGAAAGAHDGPPVVSAPRPVADGGSAPPVTMRRLPDDDPGHARETMEGLPPAPTPAPVPSGGEDAPDIPTTWTVQPGDHFWGVAERTLTVAWGRAPADAETGPYWRVMVAGNRDRLRDPGNADLLFPGQVLVVPAAPPPPAA